MVADADEYLRDLNVASYDHLTMIIIRVERTIAAFGPGFQISLGRG
jgi:hypothetical protein